MCFTVPSDSFTHITNQLTMEPSKEITPDILYQTGIDVFENYEDYEYWLNSEILNLGGRKLSNLIRTEAGRRDCYCVLNAILHGTFL